MTERNTFRTPAGHAILLEHRDGTNDFNVTASVVVTNEYGITTGLTGWAIDIGAHLGAWSLAIARDNPGLMVVAVEAVPENVAEIRHNILLNGLGHRVKVVEGGATSDDATESVVWYGYRRWGDHDEEYVRGSRFIGNQYREMGEPTERATPEPVGLAALLTRYGIPEVEVLKIDCEGCELAFLSSPAVARVRRIVGEYHAAFGEADTGPPDARGAILALLSPTHDVTVGTDTKVGLFMAVRR